MAVGHLFGFSGETRKNSQGDRPETQGFPGDPPRPAHGILTIIFKSVCIFFPEFFSGKNVHVENLSKFMLFLEGGGEGKSS